MRRKRNIMPQMFDVLPVNESGSVDVGRIKSVKGSLELRKAGSADKELESSPSPQSTKNKKVESYEFGMKFDEKFEMWAKKVKKFEQEKEMAMIERERELKKQKEALLIKMEYEKQLRKREEHNRLKARASEEQIKLRANEIILNQFASGPRSKSSNRQDEVPTKLQKQEIERPEKQNKRKSIFSQIFANYQELDELQLSWKTAFAKPAFSFATVCIAVVLIIGAIVYGSYGIQIQREVQVLGQQAIGHLQQAKEDLMEKDFQSVDSNIQNAANDFAKAQRDIELLGGDMLDIVSGLPLLSKISSGKNVVYAGNELAIAAKELSKAIPIIASIQNPLGENNQEKVSLVDVYHTLQTQINNSKEHFNNAEEYIEKVNIEDLPAEYQEKFRGIKVALPVAISTINAVDQHSEIFLELLGDNGPRKYLLIFQNNNEMRATGGFIGSYGIVHIMDGHVKKVMIDGIFNPDGQFKEDIIPPRPLQKITAGWSTHDANWYPHFPRSARKLSSFYEKTGGPTIDGIITLTPVVMKKMLQVTGPIKMEEYGTVIDSGNFIEKTQFEVEIDYDREENKPKKFLADLAPIVLEKMFNKSDANSVSRTILTFTEALKEKHILLYSYDQDIQGVISKMGWSGEIKETQNDFLMVINSNINGYKTDGVIDEQISHKAELMGDGTVIDTVKIKRTHKGGDSEYEWWNKVNSNFMRVYVPQGSKLISASGHTRELIEPPLDYEKLGFKKDDDVVAEEQRMSFDENTGTRIYDEDGKTVFGNWVYVSPKETVEVEYVYMLPFKIKLSEENNFIDTYSLLVQKQPGSIGSQLNSEVVINDGEEIVWKYPENIELQNNKADLSSDLAADRLIGIVLKKDQ